MTDLVALFASSHNNLLLLVSFLGVTTLLVVFSTAP